MGCSTSKPEIPKKVSIPKTAPNFGRRSDLNPKDFMICKENNLTVTRTGDIFGQQFIIEDCIGCSVTLMDHIASMTIDSCKQCQIITGILPSYYVPFV